MKKIIFYNAILILLFLNFAFPVCGQTKKSPVKPFIPDIIMNYPNVRDLAVSTDEKEIYFTVQSFLGEISAIVTIKKVNGKWTDPAVTTFSGQYHDLEPFLAPDGLRLYFVSNRPVNKDSTTVKDYDIWFVQRNSLNSQWSDPVNPGSPLNSAENEFYPSVSIAGNLYFTSDGIKSIGKDDIFMCKREGGKFLPPESIGDSINTSGYEFNAFIAPDESFLIYTCYNKPGGYGSGDLYISYNLGESKTAQKWSVPENMGKEINSAQMDYCPFVNLKTGILYFTSKRTLVTTKFEKPRHLEFLIQEMRKYENGQSRLYETEFTIFKNK